MAPTTQLVSIRSAAETFGVSEKTIRRRIAEGQLKAYRLGPRAIRVDLSDLGDLLRPIPTASAR
jgi:excisionase family DNA binding protein